MPLRLRHPGRGCPAKLPPNLRDPGMTEARPVVLTLPSDVANRVEAIQQRDPELVAQMLRYCAMRETIFQVLARDTPQTKVLT